MRLPHGLTVYEINTAAWLERLGRGGGGPLSLGDVPGEEWDPIAALPVDAVWLMGVWQRSPEGLRIALADPGLQSAFRAALPDLRPDDVIGSPYCVRNYAVEDSFGGPADARGRPRAARGTRARPDSRLRPKPHRPRSPMDERAAGMPDPRHRAGPGREPGGVHPYAGRGRSPRTGPVLPALAGCCAAQCFRLRAARRGQRDAHRNRCPVRRVRCDMAMLMTNEVFARTWGDRAGAVPDEDYWPTSSAGSRQNIPTCCSWPRPTGTWNGRCSSRASTSATTSASTTGCRTIRPTPSAATCRPTAAIRRA